MELEPVIGLEIHVQLKTKSKMFCTCNNASEGAQPNTLICPICTGHPGTLPVPNRQAIAWAVMAARALNCTIPEHSKFDRKHYFYPDLPKGYQISQYDEPIGVHGSVEIDVDGASRVIRLTRLHLEEDVGKLVHSGTDTFVDFNRAGTPLIEIVTEPDLRTPAEAKAFLQELRLTMRYLGVSNADMEKGELRCDANISLRRAGAQHLTPKTEIKNLNSFRSVERALHYEIDRQHSLWEKGTPPTEHATRGWDEDKEVTVEQRTKEAAADYRFFPEPDIPPLHFTPEFMADIAAESPELPASRRKRFVEMYGLHTDVAEKLIRDAPIAPKDDMPLWKYFEEVVTEFREYADTELGVAAGEAFWKKERAAAVRMIANWLSNRIAGEHRRVHGLPVPAADVARLMWMVHQATITMHVATEVYEQMVKTKKGPHLLIEERGLEQVRDATSLEPIIASVIKQNPTLVELYRRGKKAVLGVLVGVIIKETKGRANAPLVRRLLESKLK